jgi:hypothetical protein
MTQTMQELTADRGWNESDIARLALAFLARKGHLTDFEDYLARAARNTAEVPKTEVPGKGGLHTQVSAVIPKAEDALREAIRLWKRVEYLEGRIQMETYDLHERFIAARGVGGARTTVDVLEALLGKKGT